MRKIILFFSILFLWTCGGGGESSPTEPEPPPIVINLTSLTGQAQKGPFNNGTAINIAELTSTLSPTGRNFSSAITDNTGRFAVANVQLESPYVELRANGYYFNEVSNEISSGQLTLYALSNLTGKTSLNVNIITHLEKNRMTMLMSGDNPQTFAQAKNNAQTAVFAIFDYSRANVPESELLDISQGGAANGKLLAMSAILQGDLTVGQMSELLANISTDIAADGTLDDASLRATLINNSKNLDMAAVRSNLQARYTSLGITATIPDFETEVNQFLKPPVVQDIGLSIDEDTTINITLNGSDPEGESITYSLVDDSNNATISLNGNVASYTPNAHFNGTDTFTYKANDGTSDSNLGTVTVVVNAVDDDPNTDDVSSTTDEDTAVDISLTADEYDGENYSFGIVSDPSNGTVSVSGATATYTPNQDWNGTDTFTFEATDNRIMFGKRNVATATITVNAINDAPTSSEVSGSSDEDTAIDVALSATDVDQDNLTYSIVSDVSNGTTSISGSTLTYTPNQDWNGTDTFAYKVNDGTVDSNTSNGTITIASINDIPIANNMTISTNETRFISVNITLDATDVDGDNLTYTIVSDASNATTSLSGNIVTYVPTTDWNGEDSFTYKVNDGTVDSNTATVTITVNAVNDAPVLVDRTETTDEDNAKTFSVLSDVTDVDSDGVSYHIVSQSSNGAVTIATDLFTYTPNDNWNGTDTFTWKVNDGSLDSNTATVTITVNPVNDAPTTADIAITMDENRSARMIGIELQGSDVEGDDLTYSVVSDASNGSTNPISSGYLHYFPNDDWNGTETITYKANDGSLDSNTSTITVTVTSVNDAPTTSAGTISTNEDTAGTIDLSTISSDIDGDNLTYTLVSEGSNGTAGISGSTLTFTPTANWNGTTSDVTFKVNDGTVDSNTSTITVTVTAVNDAPVSSAVSASTSEDIAKTVTLDATDVEGDALTYSIVSNPSKGSLGNVSGTDVVYTPNANWNGIDTFTYKANDGVLDGNTSTVTIDIANVGGEISFLNETNDNVGHNNTHRTEDAYTLKWNYTGGGTSETYNIYLNHYEGQSQWGVGTFSKLIATVDPQVSRYDGTFDSDLYYHGEYYFMIIDADESIRNPDESTLSTFNILPKDAYATMVDPNGGEELIIGSTYTIKYDISDDVNTGYNPGVELHLLKNDIFGHLGEIDGVSNYINSNGEYEWNITNVYDPGTYLIQIRAMSHLYDYTDDTFTIRNEVVGTLKTYPDLTSGYDEFFSDIVYDENGGGGYLVGGFTRNTGDSGGGGTWKQTYLSQNEALDTGTYEALTTTLSGLGVENSGTDQAQDGTVHFFDISERSSNGGYLVSNRNDYLWSVTTGGVTHKQFSGNLDGTYKWIDSIKYSYQTSDGGYIILGWIKTQDDSDQYPVIAKIDASLNIDYFKVLDSHVTDASLNYGLFPYSALNMVQVGDGSSSVYYVVACNNLKNISGTNKLHYYKVSDGGSSFSVDQHVNLSSIANSPTQISDQSGSHDTMAYLSGSSGTDNEFVILTSDGSGGTDLTRYNIDSAGSAQIGSTYDLGSQAGHMEIVLSNNYIYIVEQSGDDIKVTSLSDVLSLRWEKTLDITGLGQQDRLGGVTSTKFGTNGTGIAIAGSTKDGDNWDGFILLLDHTGNRIY